MRDDLPNDDDPSPTGPGASSSEVATLAANGARPYPTPPDAPEGPPAKRMRSEEGPAAAPRPAACSSQQPAADSLALYRSVRVRQPTRHSEDDVYFDYMPGRREPRGVRHVAEAAGDGDGSPGHRARVEAEAAAARKAAAEAAKEQARRTAEAEAVAWDLADGIEETAELDSMLRILHELFAAKYVSFARPFTDAEEAAALGIHPYAPCASTRALAARPRPLHPSSASPRDAALLWPACAAGRWSTCARRW